MNAGELWSGNDYAHTDNISRGVAYYPRATRVKVMRVFKVNNFGNTKATTMVEVLVLEDDGTPKKDRWDSTKDEERTVRARDIFMRWDEYASERKHRNEKAAQIEAEAAKERAARAEETERRRAAAENRKTALIEAIENKMGEGFDRLWISSISDYTVVLNRNDLERWLGVNNGTE